MGNQTTRIEVWYVSMQLTKTPQALTSGGQAITQFSFGAGWDVSGGGQKGLMGKLNRLKGVDLDVSVVVFDASGQPFGNCHYDNARLFGGAITHTGDNRTGKGEGIDEEVMVDLPRLPDEAATLVCVLSSYKGATFAKVNNAECVVTDRSGGKNEQFGHLYLPINPSYTAVVLAKAVRTGSGWAIAEVRSFGNARNSQDVIRLASQNL